MLLAFGLDFCSRAFPILAHRAGLQPTPAGQLSGIDRTKAEGLPTDAVDPYRTWQYRLLDHVVSADEERLRDRQPELLGGLEVNDPLEFGRALDRPVGRPSP